jgi:hypothetical protein
MPRGHGWVAWLPTPIACRWLAADAAQFWEAGFVRLPAFSVGLTPIKWSEENENLLAQGVAVEVQRDGNRRLLLADQPLKPKPGPEPSPTDVESSNLVAQPIGY